MANAAANRKSSPKHSLNLPDLDQARSAVLNRSPSEESPRGYRHEIDEFIAWYQATVSGRLFRSINKNRVVWGDGLTEKRTVRGNAAAYRGGTHLVGQAILSHASGGSPPGTEAAVRCARGPQKVVWYVVKNFGRIAGIDLVAPHDLRRTCAQDRSPISFRNLPVLNGENMI